MRVALISDLHGNATALRAALRDIDQVGVDRTVCLGDTATLGASPVEVLGTLRDLGIPCIEGNHDAFLLDPQLVATYARGAHRGGDRLVPGCAAALGARLPAQHAGPLRRVPVDKRAMRDVAAASSNPLGPMLAR